ncbi:guanosine polyphosphate pyrophosphohydrolase [Pusillimonas sp. T2]|uniref:HD domain-containing protein n=1 Tax=Pusillimonas sp. T2 TaxID=1548123 RepID=UPI000B8E3A7E|nr:HD domain-containing protein [Pusillimonas sp. T2]OXR48129.1 guanosine polyphosphate pyrophosphohydrolase [Pusillimonas sp. T2]
MSLAYKAMMIARHAHKEQRRKYTNAPYTDHLSEVAGIVATVTDFDCIGADAVIATAWLHDIIEDCGYTCTSLWSALSQTETPVTHIDQVVRGVHWLSDTEKGNRETRKRLSRERLAKAPGWVQTIKCADLISNTGSIVQFDPAFAKTYLKEKQLLLEVMTKADRRLWDVANELLLR